MISSRQFFVFILLLVSAAVIRLALSAWLPVMEFSEARYAEIARKILVLEDWTTLWFSDSEPFWGKPPLAFWSIAVAYLTGGISESMARFPSLLFTIATGFLLFIWLREKYDWSTNARTLLIYASFVLVLQSSGSVITDPLMVLTTTATMVLFWEAIRTQSRSAAYGMWTALGLGLLAKGPIAIVIPGLCCGLWVILTGSWQPFWRGIRLPGGMLIMLLVAVPWYYVAELRTPGFLDYFLIGEHFSRYTESQWQGDPYGAVKDRPFGTIWVFFIAAALPWSLIAVTTAWARRVDLLERISARPPWATYLVCWTLVPLVFFSPAKNVLMTYALPSLPAFAVLSALVLQHWSFNRILSVAALSVCIFGVGTLALYQLEYDSHRYNQRPLIEHYQGLNLADPGILIFTGKPRFAPQFYTQGKVRFENTETRHGMPRETFYIAVRDRWLNEQRARLEPRCHVVTARNEFTLFYCPAKKQNAIDG